jgi:mxaJ protein
MCSAFRRFLLGAAVLSLLSADVAARELRVCADPNNLPFSNAKLEGFENKIVDVLANELHADIRYTWWAQRRGFIRNTLKAELCDLVPGTVKMDMLRTTAPYYRSSYVFVTRADTPPIGSFDDPALRSLKIGVQLIGNDGFNTPPGHVLAQRGIVDNVRGYPIYGDYRDDNPAADVIRALEAGDIDVAVVWGPLGGYFAKRRNASFHMVPVTTGSREFPMVFDISMGVRRDDKALLDEVDAALEHRRGEIDRILAQYGVPRVDQINQGAN